MDKPTKKFKVGKLLSELGILKAGEVDTDVI
jgi:hypothetical protein